MKVTLVMVASLDGRTTRGSESRVYQWTSPEDQAHLREVLASDGAFIMGQKTFLAMAQMIKPSPRQLFVALVPEPVRYADKHVQSRIEFSNEQPAELIKGLADRGYAQAYLLGGETTNAAFFHEGLVDEVVLTVEPRIFGAGRGIAGNELLDISLRLVESKKLNETGTTLLRYEVLRPDR